MKFKSSFILFFVFISGFIHSNEVDSLKIRFTDSESDSEKVEILLKLTNITRFYDNNEALEYGRKAYTLAKDMPHNRALAESLYLIGRLKYSISYHDSALIYFQQGLQLYNQIYDESGIGDCLVGIGDYYYFIDEYKIAEEYYLNAIPHYEKIGKSAGIGNIYISLGDLAYSIDNYSKASQYYQKAFSEYDKAHSKLGMATSFNCMADIDYEQKQYQQAMSGYRKAKKMFVAINDLLGTGNCTQRMGSIYYQLEQYDSALTYFENSFELYEKIGSLMGRAYSLRSTGLVYIKQNQPEDALSYFQKSYALFQITNDKMGIANSHFHFGEAYYYLGDYQKCIDEVLNAYDFALEINSSEVKLFTTELLAKSYAKIKDFEKAFKYQQIHKLTQDSLNSEENIREITQLQMQFQFNQEIKEKEIEQMKLDMIKEEELKRQKLYSYLGFIGGFVTLIIALIFYRNFRQKQKTNLILAEKNEIIASKNKDLTDSIEYAKTLQNAILPDKNILKITFPNSFVYDKPKDIVSGDFHWFIKHENQFIVTAADCTGHGVPGAFMSLLGNEFLHQVVSENEIFSPKKAIIKLDKKIKESLHIYEQHKRAKDGMDMALCSIDLTNLKLTFCGAYNPLYIVRKGIIEIYEGNKGSVGCFESIELEEHQIQLEKEDSFYMFSDGYLDQFGGDKGKKFMKKRFQQLLLDINNETMEKQKELLNLNMKNWMGNNRQVDDMLVIGIKI